MIMKWNNLLLRDELALLIVSLIMMYLKENANDPPLWI